jgi:hypothetical protein
MEGSGHDRIEVRSGICAGGTEKKHGKVSIVSVRHESLTFP